MKPAKKFIGRYPSEISREQFELVRPLLESAKKKTKPRKYDLYDVFNAVLYVLKSDVSGGCFLLITLNGEQFTSTSRHGKGKMKKQRKAF